MFKLGDKVVYKANAVCNVESIEVPSFIKEKDKKYYKLKQLYSIGNDTIFVPVDTNINIRPILSKDQAEKCFETLKSLEIEQFSSRQPAMISAHFNEILSDGSMESSLKVLKELMLRSKEYESLGKKLRQVEESILKSITKQVSEELSLSLGIEIEQVKEKLKSTIQ